MADDVSDLPLIPEDSISPDDAVDAAAASRLDSGDLSLVEDPPEPFGKTPLFDFDKGRFVLAGGSPVYVSGLHAVEQWCLMVIHSARYAHAVFSDDFGMEDPDSPLGEAADVDAAISDWGVRLEDALLVHDRITALENFTAHAEDDVIFIDSFEVVTDEGDRLDLSGTTLEVGA